MILSNQRSALWAAVAAAIFPVFALAQAVYEPRGVARRGQYVWLWLAVLIVVAALVYFAMRNRGRGRTIRPGGT
jgi:hypothetical protein